MKKLLFLLLAVTLLATVTSCYNAKANADLPAVYSSPADISVLTSPKGENYHLSTFTYDGHRYLLIENDYDRPFRYARFQVIQTD